ncbi:hypothetical protein TNCV_635971 [Trichonephila clavipes]|nr:hypothetical protein TNCV_635971 [Trichonephila clavipes]
MSHGGRLRPVRGPQPSHVYITWDVGSLVVRARTPDQKAWICLNQSVTDSNPGATEDSPCRVTDTRNSDKDQSPPVAMGCSSLAVKVTDSKPACHEFEPSTTDLPFGEGGCTLNTLRLKRPPVGVV